MAKRPEPPFAALGGALRDARKARGLSQEQVADATGISRRQIVLIERGENVSLSYVAELIEHLGIKEVPLGLARVRFRPANAEKLRGSLALAQRTAGQLASLLTAMRIIEDEGSGDMELVSEIAQAEQVLSDNTSRANVLKYTPPPAQPVRITLADEAAQIEEMKRAIQASPSADVEWRESFRGRGRHRVARAGDAAAGAGAEAVDFLDEEDVVMREIPEHYWKRGARTVMRVRGDSLTGLGYLDRDLLFIKPAQDAKNNSIVVATYQGLVYVKALRKKGRRAWLLSAPPIDAPAGSYPPIAIEDSLQFRINGVVVGRSGYARDPAELPDPE